MIQVISMRQAIVIDPEWRNNDSFLYAGRGSPWGNPFRIGPDGSRADVITKYRNYAIKLQFFHTAIEDRVFDVDYLVCYCAPRPCHCDLLKGWQEEFISNTEN